MSSLIQNPFKIRAIICIVIGLAKASEDLVCSYCRRNSEVYDLNHNYKDISNCTIESRKLKSDIYRKDGESFRFIKNLSPNTPDLIVERGLKNTGIYDINCVFTCFYMKERSKGARQKKSITRQNKLHRPKKSILVAFPALCDKAVLNKRIKEARRIKKKPKGKKEIEESIEFLCHVMNRNICKIYIEMLKLSTSVRIGNFFFAEKWMDFEWFEKYAKLLPLENVLGYNLYCKIKDQQTSLNILNLFPIARFTNPIPSEILKRNTIPKLKRNISIETWKEELFNDNKQIIRQIESIEEICALYAKNKLFVETEELLEIAKYQTVMYLNILSSGGIPAFYDSNRVFSGYYIDSIQKIKEKTPVWNRNLVEILMQGLIKYSEFEGDAQQLVDIVRGENKKIICAIKREEREDHFTEYFYIRKINKAFKNIKKIVKKRLYKQYYNDYANYVKLDKNKSTKEIDSENRIICNLLFNILFSINIHLSPVNRKEVTKRTKEKIYSEIATISAIYIKHESREKQNRLVKKKKKEIARLLLKALVDKQLVKTKCKDLSSVLKGLRKLVEEILGCMFDNHSNWTNYTKTGALEKTVLIEEEYIRNYKRIPEIIKSLVKFENRFKYDRLIYTNYLIENTQVFKSSENIVEWFLNIENEYDILQILKTTCETYSYINNLATYNEIWENPAVLFLKGYTIYQSEKPIHAYNAYIIYMLEKNKRLYRKSIEFTTRNLEAFRNAKTSADIEAI